jgi:hypothetical protein
MIIRKLALLFALAATLPLIAEDRGKEWIRVTKVDRVDFAPGGAIRFVGSHGDLNVEGWDRPEVEVEVTRSTLSLYDSKAAAEARQRLDRITVTLDRKSASDLRIVTAFPPRTLKRLFRGKSDVIVEYRIRVPRNSNLTAHDDLGAIVITGVDGDVDARMGHGDIVLMIPGGDASSIDARSGFGGVYSDLGGAAAHSHLVGRKLAFAPATPRHKILLRADVGNINIQQ